MEICAKNSFISIFSLFSCFKHYFIRCVVLVLQLQTQQVMTSQIRSHIEHLIHTYYILLIIIIIEIDEKFSLDYGFNTT